MLKSQVSCAAIVAAWMAASAPAFAQSASEWQTPEYERGGFLDMVNAAEAYAQGYTGAGVLVGVVDTGIDASHPEFAGKFVGGYLFDLGIPINPGESHDPDGHGTHVSGIIAASRNGVGMHGVAFDAQLAVTDWFGDNGAISGWTYLTDLGAQIISNSFGLTCDLRGNDCVVADYYARPAIRAQIDAVVPDARYAVEHDVLMVFALGNASLQDASVLAALPAIYPELEQSWLAVGALDAQGNLASYTNWCGVAAEWCLVAPGTAYSTYPLNMSRTGYRELSGTSMATPVVSGVAALVQEAFPWFSAHDLQQTLLTTATDMGAPGVDEIYGWGLVNAAKAVKGYGMFVETAILDTKGYSSTFSNNISGAGGLVKLGAGKLTLTGTNSYTGNSTVREGGLAVNGSVAGLVIAEGAGTLSGNGRVGAARIAAGGAIAPGNSIGTLTVAGDYVQQAGGTYAFEFSGTGSDQIVVGGSAQLDGTLALIPLDTDFRLGTSYAAVTAAGGLTGAFATIAQPTPFLTADMSYDGGAATVTLAQGRSFTTVGATPNERALGIGLDTLTPGSFQNSLLLMPTEAAAQQAMTSLTGAIGPSAKGVIIEESQLVRSTIYERLTTAESVAPADMTVAAPADIARGGLWARGYGSWGSTDGDGNAAGLDRSTGGFLIGADTQLETGPLGGWRLGILGGYSETSFDSNADASDGSSDTVHLGLYAGHNWDAVRLRLGAAYGWNSIETERVATFPQTQYLDADYDAGTAQVFGELGYGMKVGTVDLEPFAGLAYVSLHTDSYAEQGGPVALTAPSDTTDVTYTTLGLRAATTLTTGPATTTLRGMIGWRHAFGDVTPTSVYQFAAGSAPFTIAGLPLAENALVLDVGLDVSLAERLALGVSYGGQFGDGTTDQSVAGTLTWKF